MSAPPSPSLVLTGARVMTCSGDDAGLGLIDRGAIVCSDGRIAWIGPQSDLPAVYASIEHTDVHGRLVTPGLVDCHTHLPFAGDRAREFGLRARGAHYAEIAAAGGGIAATVTATRAATSEALTTTSVLRTRRALAAGTTTMEAKSGYDLTVEGELRVLDAVRAAAAITPVQLEPTLLAHVVPPDIKDDADARAAYVAAFADRLVPVAAARRLATSVDVYCDEGAYTLDEMRRILTSARKVGLGVRAHVGQFADLGGAELLGQLGARSADHLENVSDAGIAALSIAGVVAVMLPAACVQLRMTPPPVDRLRLGGVAMAIATDFNPGTSHGETLPIQMWLATTLYGMTVDEAWLGVTRHAARALGRSDVGVLEPGARGDLVVWETDEPAAIPYCYASNLVARVYSGGQLAAAT